MINSDARHYVFKDMKGVRLYIASSFFCLVTFVTAISSWYFFPNLPLNVVIFGSMFFAAAISFIAVGRYIKQREAVAWAQNEYREMMETEKKKGA